jgi:hypothetical protein
MLAIGGWSRKSMPREQLAPWRFKPFENVTKAGLRFTTSPLGSRFFQTCECHSRMMCAQFFLDTIPTPTYIVKGPSLEPGIAAAPPKFP